MLRLRLIHPGATGRGPLGDAAAAYIKRLSRYARYEEVYVKAVKDKRPPQQALEIEGQRMLQRLGPGETLVALTIDGAQLSSAQLAAQVGQWMRDQRGGIAFALGSAYGLDPELVKRADKRLSLGAMTLPHDLARLVLVEQLYRAMTILRGEPYHK